MPLLASIRSSYIPMAPLTSISLACLGGALIVHSIGPSKGPAVILAPVLSTLFSVYGLIKLVGSLGIPLFSTEEWLFPNPPMIGAILTGRMSPMTAAILLLSGAVVPMLFLHERGGKRRKLFRDLAGCLGTLVAVAGAVAVLSYLHGTPFLYDTSTIPMAATTALAFLLLGTGQVLAVGPDGFPPRLVAGPSARARLLRAFVSTTTCVVLAIDLLHVYARGIFLEGDALLSSVSITVSVVVTGALIARVALKVGDDMDRSEEVRRRAEDELRESEDRYRDLVEHSQDLVCTHDLEGRILSANPWAATVLGYAPDELLRMNLRDLLVPEVRHEIEGYLEEIRTHGTARGLLQVQTRNGERRLWEYKNTLRTEGVAEPIVRGMAQDITERRRSEERLARLHQQNELILCSAAEGILGLDLQGNHTFVNPAAARMLGYEVEELLGRPSHSIWHHTKPDGSSYPQEECLIYATFRNGMVHRVSTEVFWSKDGTSFPVEYVSTPIYEQGRVAGAVLSFTDITERKRSEDALRESEEKFRLIFDNASDGMILTDTQSMKFEMGNRKICEMLGYSEEEIQRLRLLGIHPEKDHPHALAIFQKGITGGMNEGTNIPMKRKDGSVFISDVATSLITFHGKQFLMGIFRDLTRERILQGQLQTAQRMESVGTLAGGIAHDFNNVLTVIVGFGEMLKLRIAGDREAVSDLNEILGAAERAAVLTRQLLTFARRQVVEPVNLDLNEVMTGLVKLIRKVTREDIVIKTFPAECPVMIHADRGQVEQVLMNLSLNARDAMPDGGQLVIETGVTLLDEGFLKQYPYMMAGRYAVLSVSDTGIGMDEKTRERIFDPFFTTKGPDKGTGLGLAMVYGIVKQHNGFIHVYSEPGKGTTFRIYFHEVDALADAKVIASQGVAHGGNETIMLAEDDESIRNLAEKILSSYGYKVLAAHDGEEAIDIFRRHQKEIAVAVLDVVMPKKGGKQAYDEMVKINPGLKVLFLSGYSANAIHESFVLLPGLSFLQKPFSPDVFARKVREVLDRQ